MHAQPVFRPTLDPLRGILLAFPVALFPSALVTDIAYLRTGEIQWTNFSAWLIVGALVFNGLVMAWALFDLAFARRRVGRTRSLLFTIVVVLMFVAGLINAFQHSGDAWSSVGTFGLVLSIVSTVLALIAGWIGYSAANVREMAS